MDNNQKHDPKDAQLNGYAQAVRHNSKEPDQLEIKPVDNRSASPSQKRPYRVPVPKRKGKRKDESLLAVLCQWVVDHQIGQCPSLTIENCRS